MENKEGNRVDQQRIRFLALDHLVHEGAPNRHKSKHKNKCL